MSGSPKRKHGKTGLPSPVDAETRRRNLVISQDSELRGTSGSVFDAPPVLRIA
jgi:hypothetical protein